MVATTALAPEVAFAAEPSATVTSAPTTSCASTPIVVNTGGSSANAIVTYKTDGSRISSVPAARDYGDIALTPGGTLYGVGFTSAPAKLYKINQSSGAEIATVTVSGAAAGVPALNALSAAPDGSLLAGASGSTTIYKVNPSTGASQQYATLPAGFTSAGDFLSLPDGDLLALTVNPSNAAQSALVRVRSNGTANAVGTVPLTYGASQSAGAVYLAGADGTLRAVAVVPSATSTAAIATTTVVATGSSFYGATSLSDAGVCPGASTGKLRVLVTGFNDWDNLGSPPNIWKCNANPTCRLLTGAPTTTKPSTLGGPLVKTLTSTNSNIAWTFQTLPVNYGVFDSDVATDKYDVVVHLGLGVYDTTTAIQYEVGAKNFDSSTPDASGSAPNRAINPSGSDLVEPQGQLSKINAAIAAGALPGKFTARSHLNPDNSNTFVCNDTHYRGLAAVASGRLSAAYFIHLPYSADPNNDQPLATATATAILRLVG